MASCAILDNQGDLEITTTPLENCQGFIVFDKTDFDEFTNLSLVNNVDEALIDLVLDGMVQMYVIGLGIGLILAILRNFYIK
ncbi:MAG: hypothetical protein HWD86_04790 [Kangiellaceae bacterium]|nr:hypothetical protein [Kangiellaceae bacterium]